MNYFKFALKSVLRYRTRTTYASLSIFIASIIVVFAQGYVDGISNEMLKDYKDYLTGDLKITTKGFVKRENLLPVDEVFEQSIMNILDTIKGIEIIEPRYRFATLLGKDEKTEPAIGVGIDFEKTRFKIKEKLVEKEFSDGLIITKELSKKLNISLGDSILVVSRTYEGGLNGIKLRVSNFVHFGIGMLDKNMFFISLEDARKLLKIQDGFTELLIYTKDKKSKEIIKCINLNDISIREPAEQIPFLGFLGQVRKIYFFIELMICLLASFVILNLMTMIVFERIREIGTLKALGMKDKEIFINFILEGAIIGSIGGIFGSLFGYIILFCIHSSGLNFEGAIKNTDLVVSYVVYPEIRFYYIVVTVVMACSVSALAAILPAIYAKRLTPQEALKSS